MYPPRRPNGHPPPRMRDSPPDPREERSPNDSAPPPPAPWGDQREDPKLTFPLQLHRNRSRGLSEQVTVPRRIAVGGACGGGGGGASHA